MSKSAKKAADQAEREKVHKRYSNRREPDVIYPAKKQVDFYDADIHQRVAVYVRVSTDNLGQETSYELQKNYYEEFVLKHPNWKLVKIYADKGISGTSTKHRVELNQMLTDSRAGKIDLIITKSVSRLARNTVDCITMVRNLAELRNPVGVFFESECIFSLNEDTNMPLSFLASIAENESRIRSRSMEVSLAQRLNGGLPLTPKLLGYSHDADGKLVINPDEAPTVKLIFYMYLSGYSSSHIAKTLEALGILSNAEILVRECSAAGDTDVANAVKRLTAEYVKFGMRVRHDTFGLGRIVDVQQESFTVLFESGKRATFAKWAVEKSFVLI